MIPSVFISSTIADLHYVREVARRVVLDFAMNPVMSDFGEIAYMGGNTAESSCYLSVRDCKLMVLIIGRRYGTASRRNPDMSVTENEFDEAVSHKPYLITLVEKDVMNFKDVYDKNNGKDVEFPGMDHPEKTFAFIDKINSTNRDNGIYQFSNADEVDRILRLQFAGLFGRLLDEKARPEKETIKDLIGEIQGLRAILSGKDNTRKAEDIVKGARFLLEDRNEPFSKLFKRLAPLEVSIPLAKQVNDLGALINGLKISYRVIPAILGKDRIVPKTISRYDAFYDPDWSPTSNQFVAKSPICEVGFESPSSIVVNENANKFLMNRFQSLKDCICGAMSEMRLP